MLKTIGRVNARVWVPAVLLFGVVWAVTGNAGSGPAGTGHGITAQGLSVPVIAVPSHAGMGQAFLVRLTSARPVDDIRILWMGKTVSPQVSQWNHYYIALAMLGSDVLTARPGPSELEIRVMTGNTENRYTGTVRLVPHSYPRQDLTLPPKMVTPPPETLERIRTERKQVQAAKNTCSDRRFWTLPFVRPVPGKVTSQYGLRRYLNKTPKNPHRGLDFRAPRGSPVKAAAAGKVILVADHYYAGRSVYIDHGNGVVSMYFHLDRPGVTPFESVKAGQTIGFSGVTGRATGPHLHFSVAVLGQLVDPAPLFHSRVDDLLK